MSKSNFTKNLLIPDIIFIFLFSLLIIFVYDNFGKFFNKNINDGFLKATAISNKKNCRIKDNEFNCLKETLKDIGKNKSVLFFGNSQTGAINNFKIGDKDYIAHLNEENFFKDKKLIIRSLWMPNASLNEFYLIYKELERCKIIPETLFIPVFLDDTREQSIRDYVIKLENTFCESKEKIKKEKVIESNVKRLDKKIKTNLYLLKNLQSINTKIRTDLYKFRNYIFGIKPTSIRPIKKASYSDNIDALKKILELRIENNLNTIIYIPPLLYANDFKKIPYSKKDYASFKKEIKYLCKEHYCNFLNLEDSIPNTLWGTKTSTNSIGNNEEIDFMHFTGEGHKVFSKELSIIIKNNLKNFDMLI